MFNSFICLFLLRLTVTRVLCSCLWLEFIQYNSQVKIVKLFIALHSIIIVIVVQVLFALVFSVLVLGCLDLFRFSFVVFHMRNTSVRIVFMRIGVPPPKHYRV